ncbi:DNA polymerase III subunit beta [Candidatus Symbiobacter mobilis]|uniref:Beta sliding clamp n=1 Tax=Candidatus Symbiobacter mobilis CR TaxID=946483 RepID=U5N3S3_9BURK|nr:DNA polymerase III subunit beta [Candidatus Symbiobacter mobilis]AGX86141.1 DNA polymerase III subunit beta [Candidatus Symbiobacter mobilis CR]
MIFFHTTRDQVLTALQSVCGIVERRHPMPILANVLLRKTGSTLEFISSDLELQLRTASDLGGDVGDEAITVGARKLIDILRSMPDLQTVTLDAQDSRVVLRGGKSRFTLQTLPAQDFPLAREGDDFSPPFSIPQKALKRLLGQVSFAMAQHDIRYYLNGILFEVEGDELRLVATDGHRLAFASATLDVDMPKQGVILPRKTVLELQRLLSDDQGTIEMRFSGNRAKFAFGSIEFSTNLVEGRFPDYARVIPTDHQYSAMLARTAMLSALQRTAILTSEKIRGVQLVFEPGVLRVVASNAEQEEAVDELDIDFQGVGFEIGFNVTYLIDVLSNTADETVNLHFTDSTSSVLLTLPDDPKFRYVVMPMRI